MLIETIWLYIVVHRSIQALNAQCSIAAYCDIQTRRIWKWIYYFCRLNLQSNWMGNRYAEQLNCIQINVRTRTHESKSQNKFVILSLKSKPEQNDYLYLSYYSTIVNCFRIEKLNVRSFIFFLFVLLFGAFEFVEAVNVDDIKYI